MLASLPMYDLPEVAGQTAALWRAVAGRLTAAGVAAPVALSTPVDLAAHWRDPKLLVSQSCGFPLLSLPASVRVVGTPVYDAPGCAGVAYRSHVVVRADAAFGAIAGLGGARAAINERDSNSGWNLLRAALRQAGVAVPEVLLVTGSHVASLAAVTAGEADYAAIDCVTFALLARHRPAAVAGVRVIGATPPSPGLPVISTQDERVVAALRTAFAAVVADPALAEVRAALLIRDFEVTARDDYAFLAGFAD